MFFFYPTFLITYNLKTMIPDVNVGHQVRYVFMLEYVFTFFFKDLKFHNNVLVYLLHKYNGTFYIVFFSTFNKPF